MKKFNLFVIFAALTMMTSCVKIVDNSEVGIKFKKFSLNEQGELKASPATGWIFYNPFTTKVFKYPVYVQRVDYDEFTVTTKDAAVFKMDPNIAYWLNRDKAVYVFDKYRRSIRDIEKGYIKTCIYDAYRITANAYTSDSLMSNRSEFEANVRAMLDNSLGKEGFVVNEFTSQIIPPASLSAAIEAKNQAIQNALRATNQIAEAEANAKIDVAKAQGEAQAMRIKADAEAYYNRTISASLSEYIIREDFIEKWNGVLPTVQGGGNGLMFDLSKFVR